MCLTIYYLIIKISKPADYSEQVRRQISHYALDNLVEQIEKGNEKDDKFIDQEILKAQENFNKIATP